MKNILGFTIVDGPDTDESKQLTLVSCGWPRTTRWWLSDRRLGQFELPVELEMYCQLNGETVGLMGKVRLMADEATEAYGLYWPQERAGLLLIKRLNR